MEERKNNYILTAYRVSAILLCIFLIAAYAGAFNNIADKLEFERGNIPNTSDFYFCVYHYPQPDAAITALMAFLSLVAVYLILDSFLFYRFSGIKKSVLVILSVIIIFFGTEAVFHKSAEENRSMFIPHPVWLWQVAPNHRNYHYFDDTTVNSDKYGFRNDDFPVKKPQGQFRVMVVGDSSSHGFKVKENETYSVILESLLKKQHPDKDILVINAAVPGFTTTQGKLFFDEMGYKFEPDVVILSFNNDSNPERQTDSSRIPEGMLRSVRKILYQSLIFLELRKDYVNFQVARHPEIAVLNPGEKMTNRVPVGEFKQNIEAIKSKADKTGAKVITIQMPRVHPVPEYTEALRVVSEKTGCLYIDILSQWQNLPQKELFNPDELHPTAAGHKKIAESLFELFEREKLVR
ncbi:MAG: GDSL-type esterase/lipase family protein [Firmicutes bacterium]|nr:GDSL-type esterase/lipase family protein [Bacillota bacterium]